MRGATKEGSTFCSSGHHLLQIPGAANLPDRVLRAIDSLAGNV
ncbi:MAG: hypothetical protein ACREFO_18655 [Acetobacteraceae bacterium]